jgi:hypothetical protein
MVADHRGSVRSSSRGAHSSRTFQVRHGSFFLSEIFVVSCAKSVFARSGHGDPRSWKPPSHGAPKPSTLFLECGRDVGLAKSDCGYCPH